MIKNLIEVKKSLKEIKEGLRGVTERVALLLIIFGVWLFLDNLTLKHFQQCF